MKTHSLEKNADRQPEVDVAAILMHLREEVQARRQRLAPDHERLAASTALDQQLQHLSEQLEITRVISAHWPLSGRTILQRGIALFNRLVRRYLRWYINPIVDQQNEFNDVTARTLRCLIEAHQEMRDQIWVLEQRCAEGEQDGPGPPPPSQENERTSSDRRARDFDLDHLQALVNERGQAEPPALFPEISLPPLQRNLSYHQHVSAHWPLEATTPWQHLVVFIHKVVRFSLRWYINPIVEQQNSFHAVVAEGVPIILNADAEARATLAALRARSKQADDRTNHPSVSERRQPNTYLD